MLKLPKYHKLTFDQLEYVDALKKLKAAYHVLPQEEIDEVNRLAPSVSSDNRKYGQSELTFDNSYYLESISKLKNGYYILPTDITNRICTLAKSI
jgi:hypothetical protein